MGWTARYAKKGPEDVFSDFTEDFTDEEEYETSCSRLIISHTATLPDSEMFVPEFGLNYPQFYLDFPSQHLSQTSEFHIDEQTSFLDPLSEREGSDSDFDNWEVFDVGPLPAHAAQTQPKGNAGSDHNQLPKRRGRKTNSTFTRPSHGELGHPWIDWRLNKASMEEYMPKYAK